MENDQAGDTVTALSTAKTLEDFGQFGVFGAESNEDDEHTEPLDDKESEVKLEDVCEGAVDVPVRSTLTAVVILGVMITLRIGLANPWVVANLGERC